MKINKWLYVSAALLMLAGCDDDWNADKLDGFKRPDVTDIKNIEYTLTDADYKSIAGNKTNKALAEAEGVADQLAKLTNDKYFTDEITAAKYVPAFLADKYPTLDNKSAIKLIYNKLVDEPEYLTAIGKSEHYQLSDEDYQKVWGQVVRASFLSPKTENRIPKLLQEAMPEAQEGDMVAVDYAYSETEPSIGGGSEVAEPTWTAAVAPVRSIGANWDYVNMGAIDLSDYKGMKVNIGFKYTSTVSSCAKWEVKNFKVMSVPYLDMVCFAKQEDGSFKKVTNAKGFTGAGEYVFAAMGVDGAYYPYTKLADDKSYGYIYPKAMVVTDGVIAAAEAANHIMTAEAAEGGFYLKDINGRYIYSTENYDSFNLTTEVGEEGYVWTITNLGSDLFSIANVATTKAIKLNFYNGSYSYGCYANSKVEKAQYFANTLCGDESGFTAYDINIDGLDYLWKNDAKYGWVASAQVNQVNHATESYLVSPAIEIAENATLPYITVDEAFRFGTADQLTVWVSTDYAALNTRAVTRAAAGCNRTALYRYDGSAWSKHTLTDITLDVMQPADYSSLGVGYLSSPATVLPVYLKNKYPYAQEEDVIVVTYYASSESKVAAKELTFDGSEWVMTQKAVAFVDQFVKSAGSWVYDPSVVIELPVGKGQPLSTLYYQTATDWVWEHIDQPNGMTAKGQGYVTSYGNNEYYTGSSAYQGNADWRPSAAKSQYAEGYANMSDDEIVALMQKHFIEVMKEVLGILHADAKMVTGVDVFYTINFGAYNGSSTELWTVVYKLVDNGKFEYVEDSLQKR